MLNPSTTSPHSAAQTGACLSPLKRPLTSIAALALLTFSPSAYGIDWSTLDVPGAGVNGTPDTYAAGISGTTVVGYYRATENSQIQLHGFIYDAGPDPQHGTYTNTSLDGPPGSVLSNGFPYPFGISGSRIVGSYADSSGSPYGYLYDGSNYTTLIAPFQDVHRTYAYGIDGSNIVGAYYVNNIFGTPAAGNYGYLYDGSSYATINDPNAHSDSGYQTNTYAFGISGSNIVGYYQDNNDNFHGFLYHNGTYTTLDYAPAGATFLYGIDGVNIVGTYEDPLFKYHGFVYNLNNDTYTTLDDPNVNGGGSTLAYGISGSTVVGTFSNGTGNHGFIATGVIASGVPEPSSVLMLGFGLPALLGFRRRRRARTQSVSASSGKNFA